MDTSGPNLEQRQHSIVRQSLSAFVRQHIGASADLSVLDEIVLSYVVSILGDVESVDASFNVDEFTEMMSAYFPDFSRIAPQRTCEWIYQLEGELTALTKQQPSNLSSNDPINSALKTLSLVDVLPVNAGVQQKRTQHLSETSDGGSTDSGSSVGGGLTATAGDFYANECYLLHEMFPASSYMEIKHCVGTASGDIDRATQMLLDRQDAGQSLIVSASSIHAPKCPVIDENELKNRIISRYSYVDKNAMNKEYRPVGPKVEPKKLVRYRDNKIVSLKGERYTDVRTDESGELKKPKRSACP